MLDQRSGANADLPGSRWYPAPPGRESGLQLPRPGRSRPAGAQPDPRRFARLVAGLSAAGVALMAGLNWLVNPWHLYSPRLLPPRVVEDGDRKCELLRRRRPLPEQLILGSSRVMRFEPRYLEARTGLPTFNAGVSGAAPMDYLALYRFATESLRLPVRSVVLGVESPALCGRNRNAAAIATSRNLSPFAPSRPAGPGSGELPLLLSATQTQDSWTSLRHALRGEAEPPRVLDPDGFMSWNAQDLARQSGRWKLPGQIRSFLKSSYMRPGDLDSQAFADLDSLLRLLQQRGVTTRVFLTPSLPPARDYWRRTGFLPQDQLAGDRLRQLATARGARFVDLSAIETFGGDPQEFYDAVHPTAVNTRKMVERLFP